MVATGCPLTRTRGTGAVGAAWPPCEHSTVAPRCRIGPGISSSSDHRQRAEIDVDGRPYHRDRRPLAVLDVDAGVVHHDHGAGRALEDDAARERRGRRVAHHHHVLQRGLDADVLAGRNGRRHERERGYFGEHAPEAADPDRLVGVAAIELDPHAGADLRHGEETLRLAGERHAGHGPAGRHHVGYGRHDRHDAADLLGIDVVDDRAAIFAVEFLAFAHAATCGTVETRPLRASWNCCLYSPRLIECVTLFT